MKINGGTEDCFPVFFFLFLISFSFSHAQIIQTSSIRCFHAVAVVCRSKLSSQPSHSERNVRTSTSLSLFSFLLKLSPSTKWSHHSHLSLKIMNTFSQSESNRQASDKKVSATINGKYYDDQGACKSDQSWLAINFPNVIIRSWYPFPKLNIFRERISRASHVFLFSSFVSPC